MNTEKKRSFRKALLIALVVMVVLLLGWQLIFPVLGIAIVVTAVAWGILLASILLLAMGTLLFYIFSGAGIFIIAILGFIWVVAVLIAFPFLFPILIPLLIILLFVAYIRRKETEKE